MPPISLAIIGSGPASLCLSHALQTHHPGLFTLRIFEASPSLRDEGAAIGLGINAQTALNLISYSLRQALDEAGGTKMDPSLRIMIGTGPDSGKHVADVSNGSQIVVSRGKFWRALRNRVSGEVEMGRRVIRISKLASSGRSQLDFEDGGAIVTVDAVIGCDGINSIVRRAVLLRDHPSEKPVFGTGYNHRVVVPLEKAKEAFGEEYCSVKTQHGWVGDGGFLLTDFVDDGESMQVIAGWVKGTVWEFEAPFVEWEKERFRRDIEGWGQIGQAMSKIFLEQPKLFAAGGRTHLDTPTFCKGNICIAGDAAQAFPPFQGAGAGQAIEDALILAIVLGECKQPSDVPKAFEVYDAIRRPRRKDVAQSSRWARALFTGKDPDVGLDMQKMAAKLKTWGSNIYEYDLVAARDDAVRRMAEV